MEKVNKTFSRAAKVYSKLKIKQKVNEMGGFGKKWTKKYFELNRSFLLAST